MKMISAAGSGESVTNCNPRGSVLEGWRDATRETPDRKVGMWRRSDLEEIDFEKSMLANGSSQRPTTESQLPGLSQTWGGVMGKPERSGDWMAGDCGPRAAVACRHSSKICARGDRRLGDGSHAWQSLVSAEKNASHAFTRRSLWCRGLQAT